MPDAALHERQPRARGCVNLPRMDDLQGVNAAVCLGSVRRRAAAGFRRERLSSGDRCNFAVIGPASMDRIGRLHGSRPSAFRARPATVACRVPAESRKRKCVSRVSRVPSTCSPFQLAWAAVPSPLAARRMSSTITRDCAINRRTSLPDSVIVATPLPRVNWKFMAHFLHQLCHITGCLCHRRRLIKNGTASGEGHC